LDQGGDVNHRDEQGRTPLNLALQDRNEDSVRLLLKHDSQIPNDWYIRMTSLTRPPIIDWNEIFVSHLVNRRQRLLNLALTDLPALELATLDLKRGRILDAQAAAVVPALLLHGIYIPPALIPTYPLRRTTVYHSYGLGAETAEYLFSKGFLDIDEVDHYGKTPLWQASDCQSQNLEYERWLIDKGADVYRVHSEFGTSTLHTLGAEIGV
jgi:ankyrin repeat protein